MNAFRCGAKGAAIVEFAIVSSLFLILMFGIFESGLLIKDYLAIHQAAREGARSAGIGNTTSAVIQRIIASAPVTPLNSSNITLEKSATGTGGWVALGNDGAQNNAATGEYIRVSINLQHQWITGFFHTSPTAIHSKIVTRRE